MLGMEVEIEEFIDDSEVQGPSGVTNIPTVANLKQTTLDSFFAIDGKSPPSNSLSFVRRKSSIGHKPFSVTHTKTRLQLNSTAICREAQKVVEFIDRSKSIGNDESKRLSAVIKQAQGKKRRQTLKRFFNSDSPTISSQSHLQDDGLQDKPDTRDLEPVRCYSDLYPNLNALRNNDVIMMSVDSLLPGCLPKPYPTFCTDRTYGWKHGKKYVRLPFSVCNLEKNSSRYEKIENALSSLVSPLRTYHQIEDCIEKYSTRKLKFDGLNAFFGSIGEDLRHVYLQSTVPFIAKLALEAPVLITQPLPILSRGQDCSVTLSQQQIAALLAHAFFCTYPNRNSAEQCLPVFTCSRLFDLRAENAVEKLRCLLHYFHEISKEMPTGVITIRRQHALAPRWSEMNQPMTDLYTQSSGSIETDGFGMLQVDFANKYIGGGVLGNGCVQEEIRFLICPEMLISMLVCERMDDNEAIVICGAQRFSNYRGYGSSFYWQPMEAPDTTPRDRFERRCCELVAIDALPFPNRYSQFNIDCIERELLKSYAGFLIRDGTTKPVASGNWGCGVYNGDLELKSLIQLMACSVHSRALCYFTFGNRRFAEDLASLHGKLVSKNFTVGKLFRYLASYCEQFSSKSQGLFAYIRSKLDSQ